MERETGKHLAGKREAKPPKGKKSRKPSRFTRQQKALIALAVVLALVVIAVAACQSLFIRPDIGNKDTSVTDPDTGETQEIDWGDGTRPRSDGERKSEDYYTVLILGAGPTGLCTLQCVLLKEPGQVVVCEKDPARRAFVEAHYPGVTTVGPEDAEAAVRARSARGGADAVLEVAGGEETFRLAWQCARPNAVVVVVALYDRAQTLPLPEMYGKNLTFKTGGVDGCRCGEILDRIAAGKLDTTPLITHTYPLKEIEAAYDLFENRRDGVIKVAVIP